MDWFTFIQTYVDGKIVSVGRTDTRKIVKSAHNPVAFMLLNRISLSYTVIVLVLVLMMHSSLVSAQSTPQPVTYTAGLANVKPDIDGVWQPNEWNDANELQLSPCNGEVYMSLKHDKSSLFGIVDVVSDNGSTWMEGSKGPYDGVAIFTFDADNDGTAVFTQGGRTYEVGFNQLWPNITFVSDSALSFKSRISVAVMLGPSPHNSTNHRIYEFSIPLQPLTSYAPLENGTSVIGFNLLVQYNKGADAICNITNATLGPGKGPASLAELYFGLIVVPENIDLIMPLMFALMVLSISKRKVVAPRSQRKN